MEANSNLTLSDISPGEPASEHPVLFVVTAGVLFSLVGCLLGVALYFRRRARLDDLRHRLLPLYTYDPAEQEEDWGDDGTEDQRLAESLLKKRQLSLTTER